MREIKFRVWDIENKEMLKVQELDFEPTFYGGRIAIRTYKSNDYFDIEDMILMQYTGLHDKNGKEIYEGDIIKYEAFCEADFDYPAGIAIICWDNKDVKFYGKCQSYNYSLDMFNLTRNLIPEVIGNIYNNPELLEVQNEQ